MEHFTSFETKLRIAAQTRVLPRFSPPLPLQRCCCCRLLPNALPLKQAAVKSPAVNGLHPTTQYVPHLKRSAPSFNEDN